MKMTSSLDISERLADAVRIEVAERFFGARKDLEDQIQAFNRLVAKFKDAQPPVSGWGALLRFVTLSDEIYARFWDALGSSGTVFKGSGSYPKALLPSKIPHGFTTGGTLAKLWLWVYEGLETAVRHYNDGEEMDRHNSCSDEVPDLSYRCLREMCRFLNEQVDRINTDLSANHTLEFIKNLDIERSGAECNIGGMGTMAAGGLDQRLAFCHVDFDALDLPVYPELPRVGAVKDRIRQLARQTAAARKDEVKRMIRQLELATAR